MFNDLLLHPTTRARLEALAKRPSHAVLLVGQAGSGKKTIAQALAASLLGLATAEALANYPHFTVVAPDEKGTISIEAIRAAQSTLTLKTTGSQNAIRRIILIEEAGSMGVEAQNAFLKTLEEPPADTCIILTGTIDRPVLPTIRSRAQTITVLPVSLPDSAAFYAAAQDAAAIKSAYALSAGQAGLLHALLTDKEHTVKTWVETAKKILAMNTFERLAAVEDISKDKASAALFLDALQRIARAAIRAAAAQNKTAAVDRWRSCLGLAASSREAMTHNANTKLLLTNVMLNL